MIIKFFESNFSLNYLFIFGFVFFVILSSNLAFGGGYEIIEPKIIFESSQNLIYQNIDPPFIIEYPKNWKYQNGTLLTQDESLSENSFKYPVKFIDDVDEGGWNALLLIRFIDNDYFDKSFETDEELFQILIDLSTRDCKNYSIVFDGFVCVDPEVIESKILEIDSQKMYQMKYSWNETDLSVHSNNSTSVARIISSNDGVWYLYAESFSIMYPMYEKDIFFIMDSFQFPGFNEKGNELTILSETSNPTMLKSSKNEGGSCLIATAAFGSELAPQVQFLREIRDNVVLDTNSGTQFMSLFNQIYYSFSPTIADYERENHIFRESVKLTITPLLTTLSILNLVEINSDNDMIAFGTGIILLNIGIYFVGPIIILSKIRKRFKNN